MGSCDDGSCDADAGGESGEARGATESVGGVVSAAAAVADDEASAVLVRRSDAAVVKPPLVGVQLQLFLTRPHAPCELCDAGRWSDASAAYGPSQSACRTCPPGLYSRDAGSDSLGDCQVRNEMLRTSGARPHARRLWLAAGLAGAAAAAATLYQ